MPPPRASSRCSKREHAFTLVELLAAVAIIGILATILILTVGRTRRSAMHAQTVSNLRQSYNALMLYANDHKNALPLNWQEATADTPTTNWKESLATGGYLGEADHPDPSLTARGQAGGGYSILGSPVQRANHPVPKRHDTFGINLLAVGYTGGGHNDRPARLSDFIAPSRTFLLGEGHVVNTSYSGQSGTEFGLELSPAKKPQHTDGNQAYLIYCDGHVARHDVPSMPGSLGASGSDSWIFWQGRDK